MISAEQIAQSLVLSVEQVRKVDKIAIEQFQMSSLVLMENAGRGVADRIRMLMPVAGRATVLCGPGNNGGDGLVIARHLLWYGWKVAIVLMGPREKLSPDCAANLRILECSDHSVYWRSSSDVDWDPELLACDLVVDAMLGTGSRGDPRSPFTDAILTFNALKCTRISIDQPTGLDAETGFVSKTCFAADHTFTFVARKPGLLAPQRSVVGQLHVLPIGIPSAILHQFVSH